MDDEPLRKINYFTGFFLRAEDLQAAEAYRDRTRWLHNLLFHGPGILRGYRDGLAVTVNDRGNEITVGTGLAIDPLGREILLGRASTHPISRTEYDLPATLHVTLRYETRRTDYRENLGNRDYSGNAFTEEFGAVAVALGCTLTLKTRDRSPSATSSILMRAVSLPGTLASPSATTSA